MIHIVLDAKDLDDIRSGKCPEVTGYGTDNTPEDIQVHLDGCDHTA